MNGNGSALVINDETETERAIRLMPTKQAMRVVVSAVNKQAHAVHQLREATAENTNRLNETDANIRIIGDALRAAGLLPPLAPTTES